MSRRLSLVFLPLLYAPVSFANDAAWDCKQDKDTKEWLCVGDEKPSAQTDEPVSQPDRKFSPSLTEPADLRVVDDKPAPITTARPVKPITAPVAPPVQPVTVQRPKPADIPMVKPPVEPIITQRSKPVVPPAKEEVVESFMPFATGRK